MHLFNFKILELWDVLKGRWNHPWLGKKAFPLRAKVYSSIFWLLPKRIHQISIKKKYSPNIVCTYKCFITLWNAVKYLTEERTQGKIACQNRTFQYFVFDKQYSLYPFPVWKWQTPHCFLPVCSGTLQTFLSTEWAVNSGESRWGLPEQNHTLLFEKKNVLKDFSTQCSLYIQLFNLW